MRRKVVSFGNRLISGGGGGGGVLPNVGYTGMCHRPGSIFHFQKSRTGPKFRSVTPEQVLLFEVFIFTPEQDPFLTI